MSAGLGNILRDARRRKGISIAGLARELGISAAAISQWEHGRTLPTPGNLFSICVKLDLEAFDMLPFYPEFVKTEYPDEFAARSEATPLPPPELLLGKQNTLTNNSGILHQDIKPANLPEIYTRDVPVYGITVAGNQDHDADFTFNGSEIDLAFRPAGLANKKDIFALYVANDSMYPAWREGALIFVSPHRPPAVGDDVVIELHRELDEDFSRSYLKRLVARTPDKFVVEQFNPKKQLEFDRRSVKRILRVVPYEEAIGVIS